MSINTNHVTNSITASTGSVVINSAANVYTIVDGETFEIDPANGDIQQITLGANRIPKATNFLSGQGIFLGIDDGAAYTIAWTDASLNPIWVSAAGAATAPTLATNGFTWIVLWKTGTTMYGGLVGKP